MRENTNFASTRINHYASALKFEAFRNVQGRVNYYQNAVGAMSESIRLENVLLPFDDSPTRTMHIAYLRYWYHCFSVSLGILEKDFGGAIREIDDAFSVGSRLKPEKSFSPNYFYDLDDLMNHKLFVQANNYLNEKQFDKAAEKLKMWLDGSSSEGVPSLVEN